MTKLVRILIVINGFLLPILVFVLLMMALPDIFRQYRGKQDIGSVGTNNQVIINGDTLLTQGVTLSNPLPINNSTNKYIEIKAKTFDRPEPKSESYLLAMKMPGEDYQENLLNILFLDKDFFPLKRLVDKKASFLMTSLENKSWEFDKEIDTSVNNICYLISFTDSNSDGLINYSDNHDLYISDLGGNNFTQITTGIDIKSFEIINHGKNVFISYTERSNKRDEYKINKFADYNIRLNKLQYLKAIDKEINEIKNILIK